MRRGAEPERRSGRPAAVTDPHAPASALAHFDALFTAYRSRVLAYALRRSAEPGDAEDVVAETFAVAWRKLDAIPDDPLPWLYAVARRVLANQRRGSGRRERLLSRLRVTDVATPWQLGEDRDGPVFAALATLSPADQEVLRLVAWEGLHNPEIADVLGITTNAVAIRLHRARARFAAALGTGHADDVKDRDPIRTSTVVKGTPGASSEGVTE